MRGGQLDRHIVIQHLTSTQSPSGEPIETWVNLPSRPAQIVPLSGAERFTSQQLVARAQFAFTIRWSSAVDNVTPLDRIIMPASALNNSPADPLRNKIYDIFAVEPVGRNNRIKLLAAVRQDELN
jgi:SPP1 family predicted phage head-tail adaptor